MFITALVVHGCVVRGCCGGSLCVGCALRRITNYISYYTP